MGKRIKKYKKNFALLSLILMLAFIMSMIQGTLSTPDTGADDLDKPITNTWSPPPVGIIDDLRGVVVLPLIITLTALAGWIVVELIETKLSKR